MFYLISCFLCGHDWNYETKTDYRICDECGNAERLK